MAKKSKGGGEYIHHTTGVRLRLVGTGNLKMRLLSLDAVITQTLVPLVMTPTNAREPLRLSNFKSQRTQFEVSTTEINEVFKINRIIIFAKPVETDFPG